MKTRIENWSGIIKNTDERWLKHTFSKLLEQSNFSVLNYISHQFEPFGFSCTWLLGESHFAVHTFPENNNSYIELSSCVEDKGDKFWQNLKSECQLEKDFGKRILEKETEVK